MTRLFLFGRQLVPDGHCALKERQAALGLALDLLPEHALAVEVGHAVRAQGLGRPEVFVGQLDSKGADLAAQENLAVFGRIEGIVSRVGERGVHIEVLRLALHADLKLRDGLVELGGLPEGEGDLLAHPTVQVVPAEFRQLVRHRVKGGQNVGPTLLAGHLLDLGENQAHASFGRPALDRHQLGGGQELILPHR